MKSLSPSDQIKRFGTDLVDFNALTHRELDYTEFVLLKWTINTDKKLVISDSWAAPAPKGTKPGGENAFQWFNLNEFVRQDSAANLARDEVFGDYDHYDDDFDNYREYSDYETYGHDMRYDDDDFEYYYEEDYGEYGDDDLYEKSLYENAMENLIKAKRQFAVAQRLMAPQRRMKAPLYSYH